LLDVLDVLEAMRCVLICMLEAVDGGLCLLEVMEVLDLPEVMCRVLLCMLKAVEGELCSLEVLKSPEVMRCVLLSYAGGGGG